MKKFTINLVSLSIICLFVAFLLGSADNEKFYPNDLNKDLTEKKISGVYETVVSRSGIAFKNVSLFEAAPVKDNASLNTFVSSASSLKLNKNTLSAIMSSAPENMNFDIPSSGNGSMRLKLVKVDILDPNFRLTTKDEQGKHPGTYKPGAYYRGIIEGDASSLAAVSIFDDMVMGVVSDKNGNYTLGAVKDNDNGFSSDYIFYNDSDLLVEDPFKCGVENKDGFYNKYPERTSGQDNSGRGGRLDVKNYFEADYQMYLDNNNNTSTVGNFITGSFNAVATIYQNDGLPIVVSEISVWTSADPYRLMTSSEDVLLTFGSNTQDNFYGSLAHLLSTRNAGMGGIAWIGVLCLPYIPQDQAGRFAFSNIDPEFNNYPTYSWTVNVIAHEMGHNFGSQHTHSCAWPLPGGGIGAIDSCYFAEGNCFSGRHASRGTIMSYCHLYSTGQGGGVNLAAGFGPLPGDTIRLRYGQAPCLDGELNSSEIPFTFDLLQNYPNPFNPSTNIKFALPVDAMVSLKVYDMSGREVASLLDGRSFTAGVFVQQFNSGSYSLPSGVYFYKLVALSSAGENVFTEVRKMVLVK